MFRERVGRYVLTPSSGTAGPPDGVLEVRSTEVLLKTGALQNAIFNQKPFTPLGLGGKVREVLDASRAIGVPK